MLVAPLSSQIENKRVWEDMLYVEAEETPLSKSSIVKIQLIQPIPRNVFSDKDSAVQGTIPPHVLDRIRRHHLHNLGILKNPPTPAT